MATSADVLAALRRHHRDAALVPEVVIMDDFPTWADAPGEPYTRRIDALMFQSLQRTAIEIKVSKADAARESYRKVQPWRRVVHRFYYAVPAGLIERPPVYGCGLWWVHEPSLTYPFGRIEVRQKARINAAPEALPQHVVQALAYRAVGQQSITREDA